MSKDTSAAAEPWTIESALKRLPEKPVEDSESAVPFFHQVGQLKTIRRSGWIQHGVSGRIESVAEHSHRMACLAMFAPPNLDRDKCMRMCLIHDLAESLVGDITPRDGVSKPEKQRREMTSIDYIAKRLLGNVQGGAHGDDLRAIWHEFEEGKTPESKFANDLDKIELLLQMVEYEKREERKKDLGEFGYVATKVQTPEMKAWAQDILDERAQFWGKEAHARDDTLDAKAKMQSDEYYG
ncbi:HD domain-containing protein [Pseudomassariella vexata]|uniref:5'-deoxynucleotidase n=1 Tax=Pseudomassariella vexata TaxID=1141098 RepID=A0A1Y2EKS9_9PEZI|nr:HD domain-containing protein [Pseudomassariella vexata]ORY71455.1 HD domain-domain-containing protein [Pseudomassariella vexata]